MSAILAAYYLGGKQGGQIEPVIQGYADEEPRYSKAESDSGRTVREEAVIPLRGLVENDRSVTMLQDVINGFRK